MFIAYLAESTGLLEHTSTTKVSTLLLFLQQFILQIGSELKLRIRKGTLYAKCAFAVVNKPKGLEYTTT